MPSRTFNGLHPDRKCNEEASSAKVSSSLAGFKPVDERKKECPGTPVPNSVITGKYRTPVRERPSGTRAGPQRPLTPNLFKPLPAVPECPPAPSKPRMPREVRGRRNTERLRSDCDEEDIILDSRTNRLKGLKNKEDSPFFPLSPSPRRVSRLPLRNHLVRKAFERNGLTNDREDGKSVPASQLKVGYLDGAIDNALADFRPGPLTVMEVNQKKTDGGQPRSSDGRLLISLMLLTKKFRVGSLLRKTSSHLMESDYRLGRSSIQEVPWNWPKVS